MPRYRDDWLIDRVMFDYLSGGSSCSCCGLNHAMNLFLPNGTADLVGAVSDLETDQAQKEISAIHSSRNPWPRELQDQVWADRVRLRQHMKRDMSAYRTFWDEYGEACREWAANAARGGFGGTNQQQSSWPLAPHRIFQVSRSEISLMLSERYGIDSAYGVVLCAALEQIACFDLTGYGPDAPSGSVEADFESILVFDRRRGFTLKGLDRIQEPSPNGLAGATKDGLDVACDNAEVLDIWLRRHQALGGPKLLEKTLRQRATDEDEGDADNADSHPAAPPKPAPSEPSFQSDRRVLRLVIARHFADQFMKKFLEEIRIPSTSVDGTASTRKGMKIVAP
jgi:hypothetical protein